MKPCILFDGPLSQGYGRVKIGKDWVLAHRAVWEAAHGPLGALVLHHHCGEPACVELTHLEPMSQSEHMQVHRKLWENRPCRTCGGVRDRLEPRGRGGALVRRCDTCRKAAQHRADAKRRQHA